MVFCVGTAIYDDDRIDGPCDVAEETSKTYADYIEARLAYQELVKNERENPSYEYDNIHLTVGPRLMEEVTTFSGDGIVYDIYIRHLKQKEEV